MADIASSFPKALSYSIKQLSGNMSRVGCKMTPDRTTGIAPNDTITLKLPNSSLVDLRSFNFFYQFSTSGTTGTFIHPRYSSSLIERISVIINGQTISITPAYAFLYNTLMDMEGSSWDQLSKRNVCEFFDPSVRIAKESDPSSSADVALSGGTWLGTGVSAPSKIEGAITHWLGFLGSCQPQILDTSDLGDVFIQIQFSTAYVLPANINATALSLAGASFTLDNVYATVDVISFASDEYYNLKASKLNSSGLNIGFYEYLNARFASITKSSGINVTWNVSANSLDQIIATMQKTDAYTKWEPIIVYGNQDDGSTSKVFTMAQIAANPTAYIGNTGSVTTRSAGLGDGFMNAYAFLRNGQAVKESRFSINNRPINYGYLTPKEIFIQTLQALGYNQIDMGTNGLNMCIFSLRHWLKYYFCHIIDLTIQDANQFWISGLNSLGSTLSITWECNFEGSSNSQTAIPVLYARLSKVLSVQAGRNLSVI
jgi:hypothetical protein